MSKNYYQILGVPKNVTESELKTAYRTLTKKYHPDNNKEPGAKEKFQEISEAYQGILTEIEKNKFQSSKDFENADTKKSQTTNHDYSYNRDDFENSNQENNYHFKWKSKEPKDEKKHNTANYEEQIQDLEKHLFNANQKQINYNNQFCEIKSKFLEKMALRSRYVSTIKISLGKLIDHMERYFSHKVSSINENVLNRFSEKRRTEEIQNLSKVEAKILKPLKSIQLFFHVHDLNQIEFDKLFQKLFSLDVSKENIALMKEATSEKEVNDFLKAKKDYEEQYQTLTQEINNLETNQEHLKNKIDKLNTIISSLNKFIVKLKRKHSAYYSPEDFYSNERTEEDYRRRA